MKARIAVLLATLSLIVAAPRAEAAPPVVTFPLSVTSAPVISLSPATSTYSLVNGTNSAGIAISESNGNTSFSAVSSNTADVYDTIASGVLTMHPQGVGSGLTVTISDTSGNSVIARPVVLNVSVTAAQTSALPYAAQCADIYTLAQGNPFCVELVSDSGTNLGTVDDPNSASWLSQEIVNNSTPSFNDITAPVNTQPGGANYGQDPQTGSIFFNPNGPTSISTANEIEYVNITCDNSSFSCGHSWPQASIWVPQKARGQNPTTDHHFGAQNNPCQSLGKTAPVNPPPYTIAPGDRCEMDLWNVQPAAPSVIPPTPTNGATFTVKGEGQCDEDADLGFYNASGVTASGVCLGTSMNWNDLEIAIQAGTWLPYALDTAVACTAGNYTFPASYFDGYESGNTTCPPEGARYHSKITDAQVNATSWSAAKKVIMRTLYHYGGIITDTTGSFGNGFSIQSMATSAFTVGNSTDTDANDPVRWVADNGGAPIQSVNNFGIVESDAVIDLSNISPYSVTANFAFCKVSTTGVHYTPGNTLPKTCGNV